MGVDYSAGVCYGVDYGGAHMWEDDLGPDTLKVLGSMFLTMTWYGNMGSGGVGHLLILDESLSTWAVRYEEPGDLVELRPFFSIERLAKLQCGIDYLATKGYKVLGRSPKWRFMKRVS